MTGISSASKISINPFLHELDVLLQDKSSVRVLSTPTPPSKTGCQKQTPPIPFPAARNQGNSLSLPPHMYIYVSTSILSASSVISWMLTKLPSSSLRMIFSFNTAVVPFRKT